VPPVLVVPPCGSIRAPLVPPVLVEPPLLIVPPLFGGAAVLAFATRASRAAVFVVRRWLVAPPVLDLPPVPATSIRLELVVHAAAKAGCDRQGTAQWTALLTRGDCPADFMTRRGTSRAIGLLRWEMLGGEIEIIMQMDLSPVRAFGAVFFVLSDGSPAFDSSGRRSCPPPRPPAHSPPVCLWDARFPIYQGKEQVAAVDEKLSPWLEKQRGSARDGQWQRAVCWA